MSVVDDETTEEEGEGEADLDEVTILNRIGRGGIAEVWLAEWRGRQVALKVLDRLDHPGIRRRFVREGRLLQRLSHPGLVRCFGVFDSEAPSLLLELLHGEPLDRRLARGRLGPTEAEALLRNVLQILDYLHGEGIVHRDIKAGNVWCAADGRFVLLDLGLAADPADPLVTTLGEVVGTHAYMAPEQIAGATVDQRSDLYSLGVTLYEALAGARPYQAKGLAGYMAAHRSGRAARLVDRRPDLPRRLAATVDRLMARDPASRPATAQVALALLRSESTSDRALRHPRPIGREAVRGAVLAVLDGGGGLCLYGPLGSGLGAAAAMAAKEADGAAVEVLRLRCRPGGLAQEVARAVEEVAGPDRGGDPLAALGRLAAEGVTLVLVEDVGDVDAATRALLGDIAAIPGVALVVTSERPAGIPGVRDLELRPLRPEETRLLVGSMLGTDAVPPGLDAALHALSVGRPGAAAALLRDAWERGAVRAVRVDEQRAVGWEWEPESLADPSSRGGVGFAAVFATLPATARALAEILAVALEPIPLEVALAAGGLDPSGVHLGPLVRLGIVGPPVGEDERVAFARNGTQRWVREALPAERKAELHAALARAAEARLPELAAEHAALAAGENPAARLAVLAERRLRDGRVDGALEFAARGEALAGDEVEAHARVALVRLIASTWAGRLDDARRLVPGIRALAAELGRRRAPDPLEDADTDEVEAPPAGAPQADPATLAGTAPVLTRRRSPLDHRLYDAEMELRAWSGRGLAVLDGRPRSATAARCGAEALRRSGRLDDARAMLAEPLPRPAPDGACEGAADEVLRRVAAALLGVDAGEPDAAAEALAGLDPDAPMLVAWVRSAQVAVALSDGRLADALAHLRAPWPGEGLGLALAALARLELEVALGPGPEVAAARAALPVGGRGLPWAWRRRLLHASVRGYLDVGDAPAALDAVLAAADAADAAGDRLDHALYSGLVGALTAREARFSAALAALEGTPAARHRALLLAHSGRLTGDPDVLFAAEQAARAANDPLLLFSILAATRGSGAQREAAAICARVVAGLHGPEPIRFFARKAVRWALGGRAPDGRDTG